MILNGFPVSAKALLSDPPPELVKEVARTPALEPVKQATIKLAQIKRQRDIEQSNQIAKENHNTEFKAVDGIGELKARIPMSVYIEMRRRCGDDYWEHSSNCEEFLKNNPQFKIKISRGTRGQEYAGKG